MTTAKATLGSVLETISQTANSVTSILNVTTKGIGMLDAMVTKVSSEQKLRHKADAATFVNNLIRECSEAEANADLQVITFCSKSEDHKRLYENAFNEFSALLKPEATPA